MTDRLLRLTPASDIQPSRPGDRRAEWGPWHIDRDVYVLWTQRPGYRYEVDLEDCTTSAEVLDWICQVAHKGWRMRTPGAGRDQIVAGLVTALDDVLDPQAHLCSFGRSKRLSPPAIRQLVEDGGRHD